MNNNHINNAIEVFGKISGIGPRSAKRIVLDIINKKESILEPMIQSLSFLAENIQRCVVCNNIDTSDKCTICSNPNRDHSCLCIVEDVSSLWALEKTNYYNGVYFVLGGLLSALKNSSPEDILIPKLLSNISENNYSEVIFGIPSSLEGQITINYIKEHLQDRNISTSVLAHGIPMGGDLEYLDDATISAALQLRKPA